MLVRPNDDIGQPEAVKNEILDQVTEPYSDGSKKVEPNQNFVKSIQELELFFEKYHGTHSER